MFSAWRPLSAIFGLILVPALLLRFGIDVVLLGPDAVLVNGRLRLPHRLHLADVPLVLGWMWAVTSGAMVVAGARLGVRVRPAAAFWAGLRAFPWVLCAFALSVLSVALAVLLVTLLAMLWAPAAIAGFFVLLVLVTGSISLLAMVAPSAALAGRFADWRLISRSRLAEMLFAVAAAWWAPVMVLTIVAIVIAEGGNLESAPPWLPALLWNAGLIAFAVMQSTVLAHVYVTRLADREADQEADHAAIVGRLEPLSGPAGRWWTVTLALPAAVVVAVTLANPYDLVDVDRRELPDDTVLAVGWPSAGQPVIVGYDGITDCLDDTCTRTRLTRWDPSSFSDLGNPIGVAVAVGADGTVAMLRVGASDRSLLTLCDPARRCTGSSVTVPGIHLASSLAVAPDGTAGIVTVRAVPQTGTSDLVLTRCADAECGGAEVTVLGTVPVQLFDVQDDSRYVRRPELLAARFDDAGSPLVAFHEPAGPRIWVGSCAAGACHVVQHAGPHLAEGAMVATGATATAHVAGGHLVHCGPSGCTRERLVGRAWPGDTGVTSSGGTVYVYLTGHLDGTARTWPPGDDLGRPVVIRCADATCVHRSHVTLDIVGESDRGWGLGLAINNGRVVVAYSASRKVIVQTLVVPT